MNINDYRPNHINMNELRKQAPTYEGTFTEFASMYKDKKIIPVCDESGYVNGVWVEPGTSNLMLDTLASENFGKVYSHYTVMRWLEILVKLTAHGDAVAEIDEVKGVLTTSNGEVIRFQEDRTPAEPESESTNETAEESDEGEGLPTIAQMDLPLGASDREIRKALKNKYGYFVARDCDLKVNLHDNGDLWIENISWGRKASPSELD